MQLGTDQKFFAFVMRHGNCPRVGWFSLHTRGCYLDLPPPLPPLFPLPFPPLLPLPFPLLEPLSLLDPLPLPDPLPDELPLSGVLALPDPLLLSLLAALLLAPPPPSTAEAPAKADAELPPIVRIEATENATIRLSATAYSTAVGPSSSAMNRRIVGKVNRMLNPSFDRPTSGRARLMKSPVRGSDCADRTAKTGCAPSAEA